MKTYYNHSSYVYPLFFPNTVESDAKISETGINAIAGVIMFLSMAVQIWLLKKSTHVTRQITTFKDNTQPSYCIITLFIIYCVQLNLIVAIGVQAMRFFFVCLGKSFVKLCIHDNNTAIWWTYQILFPLSAYITEFIFLMQGCEWSVLIFVICNQRNKLIEEILFDLHNPSPMKREYRFRKPQKNNLRKHELILKWVFVLVFFAKIAYWVFSTSMMIYCTNL